MSAIQTETATLIPTGTWAVDPVHSSIRFDVVDADTMFKSISGRFTDLEGTVEGGEEQETKGVVRTASVLTDNEMRDGHLRSADLLDTDRFPEIRFESSRIEPVEGNSHKIVGELTIKEVPVPVELDATYQGTGTDADGLEKTLFRVHGNIEWGPTRVEITADITAVRQ
ncbi:MAG: YceI family protein [Actinomycetota bacterium]